MSKNKIGVFEELWTNFISQAAESNPYRLICFLFGLARDGLGES